jgi:hypothetical protein
VSAGVVGFLVIVALVLAAVLLFRSMTKHMRRVPEAFEADTADDADRDPDAAADQSSGRD